MGIGGHINVHKRPGRLRRIHSGDNSILRELLHPDKADLAIHYSLAHAILKPGQTAIPHRLKTSEVYYILQGEGIMHIDDDFPAGSRQYISNTGKRDLIFLCIVDPTWRKEDEEL